jgi:hypothetical protein
MGIGARAIATIISLPPTRGYRQTPNMPVPFSCRPWAPGQETRLPSEPFSPPDRWVHEGCTSAPFWHGSIIMARISFFSIALSIGVSVLALAGAAGQSDVASAAPGSGPAAPQTDGRIILAQSFKFRGAGSNALAGALSAKRCPSLASPRVEPPMAISRRSACCPATRSWRLPRAARASRKTACANRRRESPSIARTRAIRTARAGSQRGRGFR